ncbi:ATP-binding protein [Carbonactinospora thermoautotrophica]|uniref:ATP-binding protein n=1 Tax=Carbonactinospora thermoautotrophica TaxID=1469144 RepID=UPI002270B09E|nr:ATP-binding protein [Carbonactinospora thermoautotrophica]
MTGVEAGGFLRRVWFPPEPESARSVRRHLEDCLVRWCLQDRFPVEAVSLVATELFANALKHSKPDGRPLLVVARWRGETFRAEVDDYNPQGPVLKWPADQDPEGRGLLLVDALAARWGHLPKRTGGKFVYAEIPALHEGR